MSASDDYKSAMLLSLLTEHIRSRLRESLLAAAKVEVEAVLDAAMSELKLVVERGYSYEHMGDLVKVLIERK